MAQEKCAKCEADATMWVTGETSTLEHPKQYLVYLCPEHFADEHEARERQRVEMRMTGSTRPTSAPTPPRKTTMI